MNGLETAMWRLGHSPDYRTDVVVLLLLDTRPDWDHLCSAFRHLARKTVRLGGRVVDGPQTLGRPMWAPDPDFTLEDHLRRVTVSQDNAWNEVLLLARQLGTPMLDRHRPQWEALVVESLPEGRAALLLRLHHSVTDGAGLRQAMESLLPRTRKHSLRSPAKPPLPLHGTAVASCSLSGHCKTSLVCRGRLTNNGSGSPATFPTPCARPSKPAPAHCPASSPSPNS
ncbi:wax ester/triacylglycerol synthase domain-containing protein [Streptomyces sp. Ac-502]|uniref:wax ester/triacylglycerol synthase domain-containing protein n=1 Tax=Streptomyces sp. Ac-502 TaxID=3342801 RepID=UPI0038622C65